MEATELENVAGMICITVIFLVVIIMAFRGM